MTLEQLREMVALCNRTVDYIYKITCSEDITSVDYFRLYTPNFLDKSAYRIELSSTAPQSWFIDSIFKQLARQLNSSVASDRTIAFSQLPNGDYAVIQPVFIRALYEVLNEVGERAIKGITEGIAEVAASGSIAAANVVQAAMRLRANPSSRQVSEQLVTQVGLSGAYTEQLKETYKTLDDLRERVFRMKREFSSETSAAYEALRPLAAP